MKLKNIAALIFRIIGAMFIFSGFIDSVAAIVSRRDFSVFTEDAGLFIFGCCFMIFSKKLARIFCQGLEDD